MAEESPYNWPDLFLVRVFPRTYLLILRPHPVRLFEPRSVILPAQAAGGHARSVSPCDPRKSACRLKSHYSEMHSKRELGIRILLADRHKSRKSLAVIMASRKRIFVLFGFAVAHVLSVVTGAKTLYVAGPSQSINATIATAAQGDSVVVAAGSYVEAVNLGGKKITIVSDTGPESTILKSPNGNAAAFDCGDGATRASVLRGFTIIGSEVGVAIRSQTSPTVVGNVISNCTVGISCSGAALITSNHVVMCGTALGLFAYPTAPNAIIEDNIIEKNNVGIQANVAGSSIFRRNILRGQVSYAVWIQFGDVDFVENIVSENGGHGLGWTLD